MPSFLSNDFQIIDPTDQTKILQFVVSSLGTSTLRTLTAPYNGNGTIAVAEHLNVFTVLQGFSASINVVFDAATGVNVHRSLAGTTSDAIVVENQVGQDLWRVLSDGTVSGVRLAFADNTDTTKTLVLNLTGATSGSSATLEIFPTGNRTITFPDATGTLAADTSVLCYNGDVLTYDDNLVVL